MPFISTNLEAELAGLTTQEQMLAVLDKALGFAPPPVAAVFEKAKKKPAARFPAFDVD